MTAFITVIHVLVSFVLVLVILLQAGKGGGLGAAFGGGAQSVFGGRGAQTFLGKVTSAAAAIFMLTSLTLSYLATRSASVVRPAPIPAMPVPGPQAPPPAPAGGPGPAQPAPAAPVK